MMISKFNKLIHNKIIWAAFAVIISLAMVGLFAPSSGGGRRSSQEAQSAGTLFGEPVSRSAFNKARLFHQAFQPQRGADEATRERIREETWQRLAILGVARQRGIHVTNRELSETIQKDPSFAIEGVFNRQRYKQLIETQMRIRVSTFEEYLRQELLLRKLTGQVAQSLWVSPYELQRSVARLTDLFAIQLVDIPYSNLVSEVVATEEDVKSFYDTYPNAFEVPETRSVKYAEWAISNFVVKADVTEESIQDYYDAHLGDYAIEDTNTTTTAYTPLDEVSDDVRNTLAWKTAIGVASEAAMQFTDDLSLMEDDEEISIESAAAKHKVTVQTSAFFAKAGEVPGLNVGETFTAAAFRLKETPVDESYSHAIVADDAIYVLAANMTKPAYVPEFDAVKEQAKEHADELAKAEAFSEKSEALRNQLADAFSETGSVDDAAKTLELAVRTPAPFSIYEASYAGAPEGMEDDFSALAPALLSLDVGLVSDPISTASGCIIIAVADRKAGDITIAESLKPDIARRIQSTRMQAHFETWAAGVLTEARGADEAKITSDEEDGLE